MFVKDTDPATFLAVNETYMVPHAFKLKLLEADSTLNDLNTHLNVVLSLYGKKGRKKKKKKLKEGSSRHNKRQARKGNANLN